MDSSYQFFLHLILTGKSRIVKTEIEKVSIFADSRRGRERQADVFDVSLDYLTGRTDEPKQNAKSTAEQSMEQRIEQLEKAIAKLTQA